MIVLRTSRLSLRLFIATDAEFVFELLNDPEWKKFIGQRGVQNEGDARTWIADKLVGPYWRQGFGLWVMQRNTDGTLLGMCGLVRRDKSRKSITPRRSVCCSHPVCASSASNA
jgi:ribosomal-protein-alanine N-acetyltransferase